MKTAVSLDEVRERARRGPGARPAGGAAAASRAPRCFRAGPAARVRGRGGAADDRLDLVPQPRRARREGCRPDGGADPRDRRGREGKIHNPDTDSGGVLLGTVTDVGERCGAPPASGDRIVTLGSLTLTPLRLEEVTGLDPASPQVRRAGTAYVFDRAAWAPGARRPPAGDARSRSTTSAPPRRRRATLAAGVRHRLRAGSRSRRQAGPGRRRATRAGRRHSRPWTWTRMRSSGSRSSASATSA